MIRSSVNALRDFKKRLHAEAVLKAFTALTGRWTIEGETRASLLRVTNWGWADNLNPEETAVNAILWLLQSHAETPKPAEGEAYDEDLNAYSSERQNDSHRAKDLLNIEPRTLLNRIRRWRNDGLIRREVSDEAEQSLGELVKLFRECQPEDKQAEALE